ncbi:MAG: peptidoglycan DD-metalloendopeptidase family protein [Bacteroidaceae bacterium]|nr:peptidoglycan DD-metalloendopeptidase family protein [Bacteroidaceae bacterium]
MKILLLTILAFTSASLSAQDLLASQAPTDHKLRAIDSLSLQRLIRQEEQDMPASALYSDWSHDYVHRYDQTSLPAEYTIDLRHFAMPTTNRNVTSQYGYRRSFRRMHKGIDVKVYIGDTIVSAFAGKVRIVDFERKGYGKYIVVRHPNGLETVYGHLSKQLVVEDQVVKAGEPIGLGGNTGRSTGSHLHFETRLLGVDINPDELFDFENQDVRGDYYVYRSNGRSFCMNAENGKTRSDIAKNGASEVWKQTPEEAEAVARAMAKAAESNKFQRERTSKRASARIHKVRKGDTLGSIAKRNNTTVQKLCRLNGLNTKSKLRLGQIIKVS